MGHDGRDERVRVFVWENLNDDLDESRQEQNGTTMIGAKRQYVGFADCFSRAIDVVCCRFAVKADTRW